MFKNTFRKIYLSILLTATLLISAFILMSGIIVTDMLFDTYATMSEQKLDRSISACKNSVSSVMGSVNNLALNSEILGAESGNSESVTAILDNACNYAIKINGITVYYLSGGIYKSSNIADIPTLDELKTNSHINAFFALENSEYVSLRTDNIAQVYNNYFYDSGAGMITCCQKIYKPNGEVKGYIFADIFPSNLYQYLNYSADSTFKGSIPIIKFDNDYFAYGKNSTYLSEFNTSMLDPFKSKDKDYLIIPSTNNFFGSKVMVGVPLSPINATITQLMLFVISAGLAIFIAVHFATRAIAGRVDGRLSSLLKKMNREGYN